MTSLERDYPAVLSQKARVEKYMSSIIVEELPFTVVKQQHLAGLITSLETSVENLKTSFEEVRPTFAVGRCRTWELRLAKVTEEFDLLLNEYRQLLGKGEDGCSAARRRRELLSHGSKDREDGDSITNLGLERARLDESVNLIDEAISQGKATVENLKRQRHILSSTGKKLKKAALSVGVSSSIISTVERRLRSDKCITYLGMTIVSLSIYWCFCYVKGIDPFWWFPSFVFIWAWTLLKGISDLLTSALKASKRERSV